MPPLEIYDLLDMLRKRPGMIVGRHATMMIVDAFHHGLAFNDARDGHPSFWFFWSWLRERVDAASAGYVQVSDWLVATRGDQLSSYPLSAAAAAYYEYLDEYRANIMEIVSVGTGPVTWNGPSLRHKPTPDRIVIGRFSPSDIYFFGTQHGPRLDLPKQFCRSVEEAHKLAKEWLDFLPQDWVTLEEPEVFQPPPTGFWALVEAVRAEPTRYLPKARPLATLEPLLDGYAAATEDRDVRDGRGFKAAFRAYVCARLGGKQRETWAEAIRRRLAKGEDELGKFFELFDDFKEDFREELDDLRATAERLDALMIRPDGGRRTRSRTREAVLTARYVPPPGVTFHPPRPPRQKRR